MNNNGCDDATDRPISLNNESTPDNAIFACATPDSTSGAATGISTGAAAGGGGLYWNLMTTMRISKKMRISTKRETIASIFMREKAYRMK